jgi:hypothetical protein
MFTQYRSIRIPIPDELQQKLPVVTAVRYVKYSPIASNSICPCHGRNHIESFPVLKLKNSAKKRG